MRFIATAVVRCRNPESHAGLLCAVAKTSWRYLQVQGIQFERMMDTLESTPISRVDAAQVRQWFGGVKEFPDIELLMQIIFQGAPVPVAGAGDLSATLAYGNHSSSDRFSPHILDKIVEDVSHRRSFVFSREVADQIPGIRISPLTVAESTSRNRICHDLTNANSGRSVNEDTDRLFFPDFEIGHALRSLSLIHI